MELFEVKVVLLGREFTFMVEANNHEHAIERVDGKSVASLLEQVTVGDFRDSISTKLINKEQ